MDKIMVQYGAVYIDPTSGNDDNYGFNKNDALQTFDSAILTLFGIRSLFE